MPVTATAADTAEVIVVGGGHNGLICAAYLARAGIDTLLVEARDDVGGCASTVSDLGARFNICNCDHSMVRAMPIIDELDLASHGLRYVEPDVTNVNRFHDDSQPWVLVHDVDAHLDALRQTHPHAVEGYRRYLADAMPVAELILDIARSGARARSMLTTVMRRRAAGAARLLQWSRRSMADVLGEYFDDWHMVMPAATAGPTVWGLTSTTPGTGTAAALYAIRHLVRTGRPVGGSGALTDAVLAAFESAGGQVRCGAPVDRLLLDGDAVRGVVLADGTELRSRRVVAACDPKRVFDDWLPGGSAGPGGRVAERWRRRPELDGYESKLDVVLGALPSWRGADELAAAAGGAELLGPTTLISPSPTDLAAAADLRERGAVHARPSMMVNVPSVLDRDMQPSSDVHVLSVEVLWTPYALTGGWPGSDEPRRWLDVLETFLDGGLQIERWRAMTPDRYEREFHMHRGHTPAYGESPLTALVGRHRETTRYRTGIDGLFLSGAATFPGAGVFGAAGRNAASAVLDERGGVHR